MRNGLLRPFGKHKNLDMWWYNDRHAWPDTADKLSDGASDNRVDQWVLGVCVAVPLAIYAVICIVTQQALVPRGRPGWD